MSAARNVCGALAALLLAGGQIASAETIAVPSGGNLQAALDRAEPGDTIALAPGAVYVGAFTLPRKDGAAFITVRTGGPEAVPGGHRITPADATGLAKLRSPDGEPVIRTAPGAHHWRVMLLEVIGTGQGADLIALGGGSGALGRLYSRLPTPHDLVLDRLYIHGDAERGQKRGIALNSASTTVTGSYISDIKAIGVDSQAICGWNGPGPYTITNNYLEAAGENLLFGGADPSTPNLVPADITIAGNHFAKPTAWRAERWTVKNLVELKNARHVAIVGNLIEDNWQGAQPGYAVLFTVRNQDGGCPWCEVRDVRFERNLVRHTGSAISILGTDNDHPSGRTQSIVIRSNVFADLDNQRWGGNGYAFLITGGPKRIAIDHNTIVQEHGSGVIQVEGPPVADFSFTNNIARQNSYGIMGRDHAPGNDTIAAYFPGSSVTDNVIADGDAQRYPAGNRVPSWREVCEQLVSCASGDYRLKSSSAWRGAGIDHRDLGAGWTGPTEHPPPVATPGALR